jgi:hypothetical protein
MNSENGKSQDETESVCEPKLIRSAMTFHPAPGIECLDEALQANARRSP